MFPDRGPEPLHYHRVGRADLGAITALELDPGQIERFFDPLDDVLAAVRAGPAHAMFAIEAARAMIGFYVLHPDRRDKACWWLGWFALERHQQGHGYGHRVMARIMASFRRIPNCRRVRLLVTPDNSHALHLYAQAGFRRVGVTATGDLIFEAVLPGFASRFRRPSSLGPRTSRSCRPRRSPAEHAIRAIAIERGPPGVCAYPNSVASDAGAGATVASSRATPHRARNAATASNASGGRVRSPASPRGTQITVR